MPRTVFCAYLQREAEGLERVPYPGELGKRIYENISAEAWRAWVGHQTMLINEYRLSPIEPEGAQIPGRGNGEIPVRRRLAEARTLTSIRTHSATRPRTRRCHACSDWRVRAARAQIHPSMNDVPPNGATMPSQRGAPKGQRVNRPRKQHDSRASAIARAADPGRGTRDLRKHADREHPSAWNKW